MNKGKMYSNFNKSALCAVLVFLSAVYGSPLSRMRRSSTSSSQQDGPFSRCSNTSSLTYPQLYYPATTTVPVHAFDTSLLSQTNYNTESEIPHKECPYNKVPTDYSLSESGLCPFDFYEDYQADRIPATIMKARCRPTCTTCIDPFDNTQTSTLGCEEVMYTMKAMRKVGCEGSVFQFEQYDEIFPVACICQRTVRPSTNPGPGGLPPN
ncbi:uncharacterized protein LOC117122721 [Anneissia japonica]|uniref:uncharacterized protein LOC117122721 n=1 Tax=Anneissia japonica TaxID=1529436 RepID=UPI001425A753|nr:uncharacterized protein LOC117122721 [Anneissia japonica]